MTPENKLVLVNRVKSFAWRVGMMVIAMTVDFGAQNIGLFDMSGEVTVVVGLVLGELSKYLNSKK